MNRDPFAGSGGLLSGTHFGKISPNHARLASVDSGLHAHFGGFFFSGAW